jgi:hypothetical protein
MRPGPAWARSITARRPAPPPAQKTFFLDFLLGK